MNDSNSNQQFVKRVLITVSLILAMILLLVLVYFTIDVLLLIFAAVLLSVFLRGLADLVNRYTRLSETLSVLLVSFLLIVIIAGAVALLAPSVAEQVRNLRAELPVSAQKVSDYVSQFSWGKSIIAQMPSVNDLREKIDTYNLLTSVGGVFSSTMGAVGNFFVVVLLAVYFAMEPRFYIKGFIKLFPIENRERVKEVMRAIFDTLRWWLIGKAGSMLFIGVLTWIGLSILGVPLALTLGLIAGLLSFIPNFGPIISAIPAILLAFIDKPVTALYVLALFVGVQLVESNLVTPLIERETIELPPALTIVFQLALGIIIGGLGLVLATPILAVVMVIVQMVYIQDILVDNDTEVEEKNLDENAGEIDKPEKDD